jgi:hypothetical protein
MKSLVITLGIILTLNILQPLSFVSDVRSLDDPVRAGGDETAYRKILEGSGSGS